LYIFALHSNKLHLFAFQDLKKSHNEELQIQVKIFEEHRDGDFDELLGRYENIRQEFEYPFHKFCQILACFFVRYF